MDVDCKNTDMKFSATAQIKRLGFDTSGELSVAFRGILHALCYETEGMGVLSEFYIVLYFMFGTSVWCRDSNTIDLNPGNLLSLVLLQSIKVPHYHWVIYFNQDYTEPSKNHVKIMFPN